ncbi:MAG: 4-hydroxy-tetrahydrodipicolinate reductase [Candidatus Omnitrophota bacterium]
MIKICVSGAKGKMGSRIVELARDDDAFEVAGEFDIGDEPEPMIELCDCLVEFTAPDATIEHLELCKKHKKAIVIGTTGLSEEQKAKIEEAAAKIPVVFSPNMSIGVNLLFKMVRDASRILGPDYSVEIIEAHHAQKKDAPSGTAKEMAKIVKEEKGDVKVPIESVREGDIVGEHTITFDSPFDVIEITHSAKTRDILVKGALAAVKFVVTKGHGLFTMKEVLGL